MRRRLPLERICAQYGFGFFAPEKSKFVSSTASDRKGFVKGESVPLDPLLPPFGGAKGGPRRVGVLTKPCKRLRDADRRDEMITLIFAVNPSVSLAADSLSLRLGHGAALICHRHIIHYRAATSLPLTQGSLGGGARTLRRGAFGVG